MFDVKQKAARTAKKAGLFSGGLFFCAVGAAFLTVAGWFALAPIVGVTGTAAIIAGIYMGFGLILIGVASSGRPSQVDTHATPQPKDEAAHTAAATPDGPPILQAFLYGLQAGANAERTKS